MSFILEALKRVQRDRRVGKAPDLEQAYRDISVPPRRSRRWVWGLALVLLTASVVSGYFWGRPFFSPDPTPPAPTKEVPVVPQGTNQGFPPTEQPSAPAAEIRPMPPGPASRPMMPARLQKERPQGEPGGRPAAKEARVSGPGPSVTMADREKPEIPGKGLERPSASPEEDAISLGIPEPKAMPSDGLIEGSTAEQETHLAATPLSREARISRPALPSKVAERKESGSVSVTEAQTSAAHEEEMPPDAPELAEIEGDDPPETLLDSEEPADGAQEAIPEADPVEEAVSLPAEGSTPAPMLDLAAVPLATDLPPEIRDKLTALKINVHGYFDHPARRVVFINMRRYRVGERIGEDQFLLEAITPEGVVINYGEGRARLLVRR